MLNAFQTKMLRELIVRSTTSDAVAAAMNSAIRALRPEYDQAIKDQQEVLAEIADRERIISNTRSSDTEQIAREEKILSEKNIRLQNLRSKITEMDQQFSELSRRRGDTEIQHTVYRKIADALVKFKGDVAAIGWDKAAGDGKTLQELRSEINALSELVKRVERADRAIEDMRPDILMWVESTIRSSFADAYLRKFLSWKKPHVSLPPHDGNGFGFYAWVEGPAAVTEKIIARLTESGKELGLPPGARAAKIEELTQQMLNLECAEERLILDNEARGIATLRRADARPEALLVAWRDYEQAAEATA